MIIGSSACEGAFSLHRLHCDLICCRSMSMPGQKSLSRALAFMPVTPWWAAWRPSKTNLLRLLGINIFFPLNTVLPMIYNSSLIGKNFLSACGSSFLVDGKPCSTTSRSLMHSSSCADALSIVSHEIDPGIDSPCITANDLDSDSSIGSDCWASTVGCHDIASGALF